jgi:methionyl-tRNA synthetase
MSAAKSSRSRKSLFLTRDSNRRRTTPRSRNVSSVAGGTVLKFVATKYDCVVPTAGEPAELEQALTAEPTQRLADIKSHQDERSLRKVVDEVRAIWSAANAYLVAGAPWSHIVKDPARAAVVRTSVNLLALAATVAWPFTPAAAERVPEALGITPSRQGRRRQPRHCP